MYTFAVFFVGMMFGVGLMVIDYSAVGNYVGKLTESVDPVDTRLIWEKCQDPEFQKTNEYQKYHFECDSSPAFEKCTKPIHKNHPRCQAQNSIPILMEFRSTQAKEIEFELKKRESSVQNRIIILTVPGNRDPLASCEDVHLHTRRYHYLRPLFVSLKNPEGASSRSHVIASAITDVIVSCEDFDYINVIELQPDQVASMVMK